MMKAKDAVEEALEEVRRLLSKSTDDEETTYKEFVEEFSAEIEGWEMRLSEIEAERRNKLRK